MSSTITSVVARAYRIPTDAPESDGTLEWDSTTLVVATVEAGDASAVGYTYSDAAAAVLINGRLAPVVLARDPMNVQGCWSAMVAAVRNVGVPGIAAAAISAVDSALWQLKANLFQVPLTRLLGTVHEQVPIYGSGGFTSYSIEQLQEQLAAWVTQGITRVKMKVGREPGRDVERVRAAREAIGPAAELDAGAVDVLQADATRCLGITGLLQVATLCDAYHTDLSTHTAALLHLPAAAAVRRLRHLEYFHDHVRIEQMLFDGVVPPRGGMLHTSDIPHAPAFRHSVAEKYAV